MKLEKWALIAEIVGSVAVVTTLIFLIIEIRGNSAAVRAESLTSISERTSMLSMDAIANLLYVGAVSRELRGEDLSTEDEFVLANGLGARIRLSVYQF